MDMNEFFKLVFNYGFPAFLVVWMLVKWDARFEEITKTLMKILTNQQRMLQALQSEEGSRVRYKSVHLENGE